MNEVTMRKHGRVLMLAVILVFQGFFLFNANRTYTELMELNRERIGQELQAEGISPKQAQAIRTAMLDMSSNVASFTRDIGWLMLMTTCFMFAVIAPNKSGDGKPSDF